MRLLSRGIYDIGEGWWTVSFARAKAEYIQQHLMVASAGACFRPEDSRK
jgi:hypothetical protein